MSRSTTILRTLVSALALSLAAACAQEAPPPPRAAPPTDAELAGAWYQIRFDTNSVEINERGRLMVKNVAYVVANNSATRVTVIGRTDRVGTAPSNVALSHRRANAVRDALITAGVPATRIDTSWTGEVRQGVATVDDVAEPRNRVVDVTVVKLAP